MSRKQPIERHKPLFRLAIALLLALSLPAHAALPPPPVLGLRVSSNGYAVAVADEGKARWTQFWPHLYAQRNPGETTPNLLWDTYFGLRPAGAAGQWLTGTNHAKPFSICDGIGVCAADDSQFGYDGATGVVHDLRVMGPWTIDTIGFSPMDLPAPGLVLLARVTNTAATVQTCDVGWIGNWHVGSGSPTPTATAESTSLDGSGAIWESGAQPWAMLYLPLTATATAETVNPFNKFTASGVGQFTAPGGQGDDRVPGLGWGQLLVNPGQTVTVGVLALAVPKTAQAAGLQLAQLWRQNRLPDAILQDELAAWQAWHGADQLAATLTPSEKLIAQRALATLRMAQVAEVNDEPTLPQPANPHGQIVASLPPGQWHIAWVRDMAYAGVALARAGHGAEAKAALDFVRNGQTGGYKSYFLGKEYLPSPVRYYGSGLEESDSNADGPNIEYDGLGLLLWQAQRYVKMSNDDGWLAIAWPDLRDRTAAVLQQLVDTTGLIAADSSIWEVHWNGKQKHFAYTSALAVRGLCAASELAVRAGQGQLAATYRNSAKKIHEAMAQLVDADQVLQGNLEESAGQRLDAAAVEALLDGQFAVDGAVAKATLASWQKTLTAGGGPGFIRNDDGGIYDSQEWLFIDARIDRLQQAMVVKGISLDPAPLHDHLLAVALAGGGLVPELLSAKAADAPLGAMTGSMPMAGFGAGAVLLALADTADDDDVSGCLQGSISPAQEDAQGQGDVGDLPDAVADADCGSCSEVGQDDLGQAREIDGENENDVEPDAAGQAGDALADAAVAKPDGSATADVLITPVAKPTSSASGCAASPGRMRGNGGSLVVILSLLLGVLGCRIRKRA